MKRENGITLITLAITIILMGVLAALLVRASLGDNLLKKSNEIKENVVDLIDDTDKKTEGIKQKWNGIL